MTLEKRLKQSAGLTMDAEVDETKIQETICRAQTALYKNELEIPMSGLEFLYQQAGYIRKRWWMGQAVVLAVLWGLLYLGGGSAYTQRSMGIMTPLFVILILPELWKNQSSASMEIEGTSYFSIRRIYAARMLLFAMVDILLLSAFFLAAAFTLQLTAGQIVTQFILPLNVTCCICFRSLSSSRAGSGYAAFSVSMIWAAFWMLVVLRDNVYQMVSGPVWAAAVALSVFYLIYSIRRVWTGCGQYWEVNVSWN